MKKKKLLSITLAFFMFVTVLSLNVAADEGGKVEVKVYDYNTGETHSEWLSLGGNSSITMAYTPNMTAQNATPPDGMLSANGPYAVGDVTKAPYSKVLLTLNCFDTNNDGIIDQTTVGTAFAVRKNVILTAAHTIWHTGANMWAKQYKVFAKYNNTVEPVSGYYLPSTWTYAPDFKTKPYNIQNDWCVVKMNGDIGSVTGTFGYGVVDKNLDALTGRKIVVAGYPDDYKYRQFYDNGEITKIESGIITSNAVTLDGESGGPVFDSNYTAWAIHCTGDGATYARGKGITETIVAAINSYVT